MDWKHLFLNSESIVFLLIGFGIGYVFAKIKGTLERVLFLILIGGAVYYLLRKLGISIFWLK